MSNTAYLPLVTLSAPALAAAESGLLIAASDRLRRECRYAYDHHQMSLGHTAWRAPSISGFESLLRGDHERAARIERDCEALLTPVAQHDLFRRCAPEGLVHLTALFEEAWQQAHHWQLDVSAPAFSDSENTRVFAAWVGAVNRELVKRNALTPAQLAARAYPQSPCQGPVHLLGFDVLNPAQQQWVATATASGTVITRDTVAPDANAPTLIEEQITTGSVSQYTSPVAELTAAICWARDRLLSAPVDQPLPRIAIVVPDLLQQHATVKRLLHTQLEANANKDALLYNLGGGLPLAQHPLVASALRLLGTIHKQVHYTELERVLVDPALPAINNARRLPPSCNEFMRLQDIPADICTEPLRVILRTVQGWPDTTDPTVGGDRAGSLRRTVREWWQAAASVLRNAGWHTARNDSEGYQATNALLDLLLNQPPDRDTLQPWSEAFALLSSMAAQNLFAPAGQPAPLQVLGYLEAQELEFDCLWITGMSNTAWPTPVTTNPLLPVTALTAAGTPRTTYPAELRFAQNWLQRVTRTPAECQASFSDDTQPPPRDGDAHEPDLAGVSALLAHWQPAPIRADLWHPGVSFWRQATAVETFPTETNPDRLTGPAPQPPNLRRATRRLQDQAACPMRGWATHQLNLDDPVAPHTLPNPIERGNVLHEALDRLFKEITSSADLEQLSPANEKLLCLQIAQQCVDEQMTRYGNNVRILEAERLVTQLGQFLNVERKRGEFQVSALEADSTATIGPFAIGLRPDRVDDTPQGQFVIDYKSTAPSKNNLLDERLSAPQIPLYVLLQLANGKPVQELPLTDPVVTAGAFAQLRPDAARYVGLRAEDIDLGIKGVDSNPEWSALLARWRDQLSLLAEEVAAGTADAKPTATACNSCKLQAFCRYHLRND